jgi:hypothetical protein
MDLLAEHGVRSLPWVDYGDGSILQGPSAVFET